MLSPFLQVREKEIPIIEYLPGLGDRYGVHFLIMKKTGHARFLALYLLISQRQDTEQTNAKLKLRDLARAKLEKSYTDFGKDTKISIDDK